MTVLDVLTEHRVLDLHEERALAEAVQAGDFAARAELWRCNQRLVVSVARRYVGRGLDLEDLIGEGNLGLAQALNRYNPARGYKFSTYAVCWIRQGITRALDNTAATIRLPVHLRERIARLRRAEADYVSHNGCWPEIGELADLLGWTTARVAETREYWRRSAPASLDKPLPERLSDDGEAVSLAGIVPDRADPYASVDAGAETAWLGKLLFATLSTRERQVITLRYGLHGAAEDYATIGRRYGISRERVRQIAEEALTKLRQHPDVAREQESRRVAA